MANGHGGKRTPSNPAPVSGPGALSKRTDGQPARKMSGMPYGEGGEFYDLQQQAPMANSLKASKPRKAAAPRPPRPDQVAVPLFAPTQRPGEPVTAGAALGPGPGPSAMPAPGSVSEILARMPGGGPQVEYLRELAFRLGV